jgi:hypothetical protein
MEIYLYQIKNDMTTQVSFYSYGDYLPHVHGDFVVWQRFETRGCGSYLYQISSGMTTQISDKMSGDSHPQVYGNNVVWFGDATGEYAYEIFLATIHETPFP